MGGVKLFRAYVVWLCTGRARITMTNPLPDGAGPMVMDYISFECQSWARFMQRYRFYRTGGYR